jgi:ubiquinol-cytochrome c reductase cytochrome c1 subunit
MLKRLTVLAILLLPGGFAAAEEGEDYPHANTDITNTESLQRGARNFMNYCSGCHSLKYLRYNRMGDDLKIPPADLTKLMFTSAKPYDTINSAMPADAATWFGKQPPDLSLIARAKGTDYVYSFLKGFYVDSTRLWGVNNMYLPNAAMPFVLQTLQGTQKPVFKSETVDGQAKMVLTGLELVPPQAGDAHKYLTAKEYDDFVRDITNFLDYAAEPIKAKRESMGKFVIAFLLVFFVFAFLLKKEYWKDVH